MIPTPGYLPSRRFESGSSSYCNTQELVSQQPLQEEEVDRQQEEEEEEEEEEEGEHDPSLQGSRQYRKDIDGKIIISPLGRGWTPSAATANTIRGAIRAQFRGPHHCWTETPDREKVSWDPRHHDIIFNTFKQKCAKRLIDMLTKARKKGEKPSWVGDEAWAGLLAHWVSEDFRKISAQNKANRASAKGGAVHTTGRKSHNDVALDMGVQLGWPVEPDELFLATHKRKSGDWVDSRSQRTYDSYQQRLNQIQTQVESSTSRSQELDGARKLELWKEVVGGKTRGRCYGTVDLSSNIRRGISSMT